MAYEISNVTIIDDNRNIVGANTYNGYVPVNPSVTINSGNGIVGGASLANSMTLYVRAGNGLVANSTGVHVATGTGLVANNTNLSLDQSYLTANLNRYSFVAMGGNTYSGALSIVANSAVSVSYGHSQGDGPTDAPISAQGSGLIVSNPFWFGQLHFTPGNRVFTRTNTDWSELWHSGNLPNPALANTTISPGNGLTGGGDLSANRTLTVGAGSGITVNTTNVAVRAGNGLTANATGVHIVAGNGLNVNTTTIFVTGGNGISVSSTGIYSEVGSSLVSNTTGIHVKAGGGLVSNATGIHVGAGNGINVSGTTIFVGAGAGMSSNSTSIGVDSTVLRNFGRQVITGELATSLISNYRIIASNGTSSFQHYNGTAWYLMFGDDAEGGFNTLRPIQVNRTNGLVVMNNGIQFSSASGNGAGITSLDATELTGTINDARIPSTIARSAVRVLAGNGMSGGGPLTANTTLSVGAGAGITVGATAVAVNAGNGLGANTTGVHVMAGNGLAVTSSSVYVNAGVGLIANNSGLHINTGNGLTANSTHLYINVGATGSGLNSNSSGFAVDFNEVTPTGRFISAGAGLSGGGDLKQNRSISLGTPSAITAVSTNNTSGDTHTHSLSWQAVATLLSNGTLGTLGSYALLSPGQIAAYPAGTTRAGSNLYYAAANGRTSHPGIFGQESPPGTWRLHGIASSYSAGDGRETSVWQRID